MNRLFKPFPQPIALSRLKSNAFLLILTTLIRSLFTPYTSLRRAVIRLFSTRWPEHIIWETLLTVVLMWNLLEAGVSVYFPSTIPLAAVPNPGGMIMTPTKVSSPLTRAYPSPDRPLPSPLGTTSTPTPFNALNTPQKSLPSQTQRYSTPTRTASPLSASTTKILNLPPPTAPSQTGLYYDPSSPASPAEIGQPPSQDQGQGQQGDTPGGDFVLIDREEREWVDNVWKGVRGKGGRFGL